jgi:hypothetical protein
LKKWFYLVLKKLGWLFDFRQPRIHHLECIDLVLENKLLLLVSWDTLHTSKIRIRPGKAVYRASSGAAVCRLPIAADSIDVILHNVWRSKRTSFRLKRIAVSQQTLRYLDEHYLEGLTFSITRIQPNFTAPYLQIQKLQLQMPKSAEVPAFNITINHFQLNDYAP